MSDESVGNGDDLVSFDKMEIVCVICDDRTTHERAIVSKFIYGCDRCGQAIYSFHHAQWFISEDFLKRAGASALGLSVGEIERDPNKALTAIHKAEHESPLIKKMNNAYRDAASEAAKREPSEN